ncbi:MAG: hypothetical protein ACXAE3_03115 [Candidatus Kariarchaeaceae archaeon]|jgi:hypothetical protein
MSSFTESDDTPFDEIIPDNIDTSQYRALESLEELLNYTLHGKSELGRPLSRFNGAERVDIAKISEPRLVRTPAKFLTILKNMEREANIRPSYGLKLKKGNRYDYIHYVLELNDTVSVGLFYFDSKRLLSVPQIHHVERLIKLAGLRGAIIIANHIGIPAKQEAKRINKQHGGTGIITIEHYDSIKKRYFGED